MKSLFIIFALFTGLTAAAHSGESCDHNEKQQGHNSHGSHSETSAKLGIPPHGDPTHTIADIMKTKKSLQGHFVRVKGKVTDVCPMSGCWVELEDTKTKEKIKVKVKDGDIVFPSTVKGKSLVVEGKLVAKTLNKKRAIMYYKHLAEEKGEQFDPKSVNGPVTLYQIQGTGAKFFEQ